MSDAEVLDGSNNIAGDEQPAAKKVDPGFKRNLIVIGLVFLGALVLFAGFILMMRGGAKAITETKSSITIQDGGAVPSSDGLTPAMREKLTRAQQRESQEAGEKGVSYIPPDILPEKTEAPQQPVAQQQIAYAQPVNDPGRDRRNQERLQAAQAMLTSMLQRPAPERVQVAKIDSPAAAASAPVSAASAPGMKDDFMVADIMEIAGARLTSPVDTDMSSFASAEITTGDKAGAQLIGTVKLSGNGVEFKFTGMRHKNKTYPINAIALDQDTSTSAVQGNLDRKLLTRYVFPVLMAYTGAYATARSQVATTTTSIGYGNVGGGADYGVSRPAPTNQQAQAAGVAAAVQLGNQAIGKGASEPVRVTMDTNTAIGVMFREPVMASQSNSYKKN